MHYYMIFIFLFLTYFTLYLVCEIFYSGSVKNAIGNLIGITLNLWITFGTIVVFIILILPTQEHEISLHLLHFIRTNTNAFLFYG